MRRDLRPFLSLGRVPIANALLAEADLAREEPRYPLEVGFCESCTLVQLLYALPADAIFDDAYPYYSSFSEDLLAHSREHVEGLIAAGRLGPDRFLVEVASNDGYLLRHARSAAFPSWASSPRPDPRRPLVRWASRPCRRSSVAAWQPTFAASMARPT